MAKFGLARSVKLTDGDKQTLAVIAARHGAEFVAMDKGVRVSCRYWFEYSPIGDPHDRGVELIVTRDVEESGVAPRLWPYGAPAVRRGS